MSSDLAEQASVIWEHAVSPSGVNSEFRPFLRMTFPDGMENITLNWKPRERLFRSWILLAGILPVEYDDLAFEEVEPGYRFLERSSMFTQRIWEHERVIEPCPQGCRVTDRVYFEPRVPGIGAILTIIYKAVFRWRHRNLRSLFG